jgi:hypothetical protein
MKTSFDISLFGKRTNFGRFGVGIYTSSTSSKFVPISIKIIETTVLTALVGFYRSDGYSLNGVTSEWKAILLNKVVVGKGYKTKVDSTALTAPPTGYDSVSVILR